MSNLTYIEEQVLGALRETHEALLSPSVPVAACYDYCPAEVSCDQFSAALTSLSRLGLVHLHTLRSSPRVALRKEVA